MNKIRYLLVLLLSTSLISTFLCSVQIYAENKLEIIVSDYKISEGEAVEGGAFELDLKIKNVSLTNNAFNVLVSVSNEKDFIYSGNGMANQGYIESISPGETKTLTLGLEVVDLAPEIVKMKVLISSVDVNNFMGTNEVFIWIPVETSGKISISEFTLSENILSGDKVRVNMILSNSGDSNISTIRMQLNENGNQILNERVTNRLLVATTTSYETYIEDLAVGKHEIEAVMEYTSENGKKFTSSPRLFQVEVAEHALAIPEVLEVDQNILNIYKAGIIVSMAICFLIIVKQIKMKR